MDYTSGDNSVPGTVVIITVISYFSNRGKNEFKIQNSKFKIQNSKFKIQNSKFKIQIQNLKFTDEVHGFQITLLRTKNFHVCIHNPRYRRP